MAGPVIASDRRDGAFARLARGTELALPIAIVAVVAALWLPIPKQVLDLLIVANIAFGLVILVTATQVESALAFSSFPTVLLLSATMRLALNVSATKLILGQADAGVVIHAIGERTVGGDYITGFVSFVILFVIQLVVITNGAGRIAEVAARFHLDSLPARQLAIDSDAERLKLSPEEVLARRSELQRASEFYGNMDGASKFIKGEAIVGVIVLLVNLIGGFLIGAVRNGLSLEEALALYATLAVGDGLATAIPSMVIALATGVLVTRSADRAPLGAAIFSQVFDTEPRTFYVAAAVLAGIGAVPGMPLVPFWALAIMATGYAWVLGRERVARTERARREQRSAQAARQQSSPAAVTADSIFTDDLAIDFGLGIAAWAQESLAVDLTVAPEFRRPGPFFQVRVALADQLGLLIPDSIDIRDNMALGSYEYAISIRGIEIGRGELHHDRTFVWNPIDGKLRPAFLRMLEEKDRVVEGVEPTSGSKGVWVDKQHVDAARQLGYMTLTPIQLLREHLRAACIDNASMLATRKMTSELIERLRARDEALVKDLLEGPQKVSLSVLHRVVQGLLAERIPVKDLATICETIVDHAGTTTRIDDLVALCRKALAPLISARFADPSTGALHAITFDPALSRLMKDKIGRDPQGAVVISLRPEVWEQLVRELDEVLAAARKAAPTRPFTVLLVESTLRTAVQRMLRRQLPALPVLAYDEIAPNTPAEVIARVGSKLPVEAAS